MRLDEVTQEVGIEKKRESGTEPKNPPLLGSGQVGDRKQQRSPCHRGRQQEL